MKEKMPGARILTTKEVAKLCHVSDATVKRWAEAGLLQSERTSGGHRRFRAEEVARFQRETGLGNKQTCAGESVLRFSPSLNSKKFQSNSNLFQAIVAGREEEATTILISAFLRGEILPEIFDKAICEALEQVGDMWFTGDLSVAQEHLATRTVLNAVQKLRNVVPVNSFNQKTALCCVIEGDFHELPSHLAQILLERAGWEVLNFGASTPLYSLAEQALALNPDLICISATILNDVERAARDFRNFRDEVAKTKATIVLGGQAFIEERVRLRFEADYFAGTFSDFAEFVGNLA